MIIEWWSAAGSDDVVAVTVAEAEVAEAEAEVVEEEAEAEG